MPLAARAVLAAGLAALVAAQNSTGNGSLSAPLAPTEYVWGAVILSVYGDHIPLLSVNYSIITPTGQTQMYDAGQWFRNRYIAQPANASGAANTTIQGISQAALNMAQVNVTSMPEVWVQQGAQAFMEGLYPPLGNSTAGMPLDGLQNPLYNIPGDADYNYLYLNGSYNCPTFEQSVANLEASASFQSLATANQHYFDNLGNATRASLGFIPGSPLWLGNAYAVWDWLAHQALNDSSVAAAAQGARYAADAYMQAVYGDTTADGGIRAIGGYTIAAEVLASLWSTVLESGIYYPLNLFFTGPEPLVSLAALMQLTEAGGAPWTGMPNPGSSLVFELYSTPVATGGVVANPSFPDVSQLKVRALLRNGTSSDTNLQQLAMFGQPTSNDGPDGLPFATWSDNLTAVALGNPGAWCESCQANNIMWCAYWTRGEIGIPGGMVASGGSGHSTIIGGVIGAFVTLAVVMLALAAAMLCGGVRFHRRPGRDATAAAVGAVPTGKRRSGFTSPLASPRGGFKGGEKLASDVDLPGGAAGTTRPESFGASIVSGEGAASGHRRVESWEMREGRRRRSGSLEREATETREAV